MNQSQDFEFINPGEIIDGNLKVVLQNKYPEDLIKGWVPWYRFGLFLDDINESVGNIDFRAIPTEMLIQYGGSIGYEIREQFRGKNLAERGCRLLIPFIRKHGFKELWITCVPENIASCRTCEKLGAVYVNTVDVPKGTDMYEMGERQKRRYRLDLS